MPQRRTGRARGVRRARTRSRGPARGSRPRYWVREVALHSDAMDLPPGIFRGSPQEIARGLKRSVLASNRTKGTKFQSAMSMLNLYTNRAGRNLAATDRQRLDAAKVELRREFGRPTGEERTSGRATGARRGRTGAHPRGRSAARAGRAAHPSRRSGTTRPR